MRYGKVTAQQVARMAARAEAAGQLGLAVHLLCLAAALDETSPLGLPIVAIDSRAIERGHAILRHGPEADEPTDPSPAGSATIPPAS